MLLLVGLGNPGSQYSANRHNVGFMAADAIHRRHGFSPWRRKFQAEISEAVLDGEKCLLLKPQTYMNESGRSVSEAMRFYKLEPAQLTVLYDELDLPLGRVRVKTGGGAGGHGAPGPGAAARACGRSARGPRATARRRRPRRRLRLLRHRRLPRRSPAPRQHEARTGRASWRRSG